MCSLAFSAVSPMEVVAVRYSPVPVIEYHAGPESAARLPCTITSGCKGIAALHTVLEVLVSARAVGRRISHSWIGAMKRARMVKTLTCLKGVETMKA